MKVMNMLLHAAAVVLVSLVAFRVRCSGGLSPTQRGRLDYKRNFAFTPARSCPNSACTIRRWGHPPESRLSFYMARPNPAPLCCRQVLQAEVFGPGQPLDASKYYIILPDSDGAR